MNFAISMFWTENIFPTTKLLNFRDNSFGTTLFFNNFSEITARVLFTDSGATNEIFGITEPI